MVSWYWLTALKWRYVKHQVRGAGHATSLVLLLVASSMAFGCTAQIIGIGDRGTDLQLARAVVSQDLEVRALVQERPLNPTGMLDREFRRLGLLVVRIAIRNTGRHTLSIARPDIVVVAGDGKKFVPIKKEEAVATATGPLGLYRLLFFWRDIGYGYQAFGLDERIVLGPSDDRVGYVFYRVDGQYDRAAAGDLRMLVYRIHILDPNEYTFGLKARNGG